MKEETKKKISVSVKRYYEEHREEILKKTVHFGDTNGNWKGGKSKQKPCISCGKLIDPRSKRCVQCRMKTEPSFAGKIHSAESREKIGKKSKEKWTLEYKIKQSKKWNRKQRWQKDSYVVLRDFSHPNKNSANEIFEHVKIMSEIIKRPIARGEIVHHINFIRDSNEPENLWLYKSRSEHGKCTRSVFQLVAALLEAKIIKFQKGVYMLNKEIIKKVGRL